MLDTNAWGCYNKLATFITNAKDVWDFCLGGLKCYFLRNPMLKHGFKSGI
ncbi:hypothetical protein ACMWQC_06330 [Helicobacter pylori]